MRKISLFLLVCFLQTRLGAQDSVTIGKYNNIESKILGGKVTYLEHLPEGYYSSDKKYPVIYMMNGQIISGFANAAATLDNLSNDRIPDMILIGISNTGVAGTYWSCPNDSGYVRGGNLFYRFLKEELMPEIKKIYRTNEYKILAGQSNTGLYVLYNFLFHPDLFNAYIVASPMFAWCPDFYSDKTKSFLHDNPNINKKLFVSFGDLDYVEVRNHMDNFVELLKQSPESLIWKVELNENTGHVPFTTLNNALLFFFSECTMTDDRKNLSISEIKSHFEKLSEQYGFSVNPKAGVLFDMAMDLKNEKKYDRAIGMFKYLLNLYSDSEFYFYYLGETYKQAGETDHAKENYNYALKINPDFVKAKVALEGLNK